MCVCVWGVFTEEEQKMEQILRKLKKAGNDHKERQMRT